MGRKTDPNHKQLSSSIAAELDAEAAPAATTTTTAATVLSRLTSNTIEDQMYFRRNSLESVMNDNNHDLLIHDTILPHRKRIRKDTILSVQQQSMEPGQHSTTMTTSAGPSFDVSYCRHVSHDIDSN
jgi:hypothetical protein